MASKNNGGKQTGTHQVSNNVGISEPIPILSSSNLCKAAMCPSAKSTT